MLDQYHYFEDYILIKIFNFYQFFSKTCGVEHCRSSSTFSELTSNLSAVITHAARFGAPVNLSFWTFAHISHKGEQ